MIELYEKKFKNVLEDTKGRKRAMLLANLMNQMEDFYKLSMNKDRFERETPEDVKALYLAVSNARKL